MPDLTWARTFQSLAMVRTSQQLSHHNTGGYADIADPMASATDVFTDKVWLLRTTDPQPDMYTH